MATSRLGALPTTTSPSLPIWSPTAVWSLRRYSSTVEEYRRKDQTAVGDHIGKDGLVVVGSAPSLDVAIEPLAYLYPRTPREAVHVHRLVVHGVWGAHLA